VVYPCSAPLAFFTFPWALHQLLPSLLVIF
jgi:hypothetical protein